MRDDEPDGPELTHNTDDTTTENGDLEDCVAQYHEARMVKNSHDLITDLCKHVDALVNKILDECGGNRAVSRVIADLKACMKASIVTHLFSSSAQAADLSLDSPQGNQPMILPARLHLSKKKTPATKEPSQSLRRKPKQKPTYSPPEKDIKHAAPKSYAELLRGATPKNLPKRPAQPLSSKRLSRTNRVFVRLPEDSALRVEADEKWVIVKVHDLPTRVTILDDNNSLSSRNVTIEHDVLPEIAGTFGASPETAYCANVREGYPTASVRLAFRAEGLKDSPRTVVLMGARPKVEYLVSRGRDVKMRRGAGSAETPNTTPMEALSCVSTATASMQRIARRAQ
ncbi:hypothetical protein V8E54_007567 [Elaphomyces granulatus]